MADKTERVGCMHDGTTAVAHALGLPSSPGSTQIPLNTVANAGTKPANPPSATPNIWPNIPGYQILGELGRGSMGIVYKARQAGLDRLVALKMIRTGSQTTKEELQRFIVEARVLASLQHPNIIQIYEINLERETPYFSMELVEGGNLDNWLGGRPQPHRQAAEILETMARAIHVAHQNGIVHRDLKPANVLLAKPVSRLSHVGRIAEDIGPTAPELARITPKITDFGLAKQLHNDGGQTESGMIMGTPSYMAPEQAEGRSREVGPAADVYGLGAILYEMLTGRPPFTAESPVETVLLLFQAEPVAPSRLQPKIPRDLETICLTCLQKEPRRRYDSAEELADDLRRFLNGEPIKARPTSLREKLWKWSRRRPALATLTACAVLAVLSLFGLIGWHYFDLQVKLDQAREDEQIARSAQEDAYERERIGQLRDKVKDLLRAGETALASQDWGNAQLELTRARDQAGDEPELIDLYTRIDSLLRQTERRQADRERLQRFKRLRNEALFQATLFTGTDLASTLRETQSAAREALAIFAASPDSAGAFAIDSPYFSEQEKSELKADCYELLLVLAEATAQARPGQTEAEQRRQGEEALRVLDRAAVLGIRTQAYHRRRAHYLEQAERSGEAAVERKEAETLSPHGPLDYFLIGDEYYRKNGWKRATLAFESVLQVQPNHFWAQYYLALCALKAHRAEQAVARLTSCLAQRPDFPWLLLLRGSAWGELGQFTRAEKDFEAALRENLPASARYGLLINRGVLRIRQGKLDSAIEDLRQAIALKPKLYQGYVNLAQAYLRGEQPEEARRQLDEAIRCEPNLPALYRTRSRVQIFLENPTAALADLDEAIRLESRSDAGNLADDHLERGRLLYRQKDYAGALAATEAALRIHPRDAQAYRLRADSLLELKRLPDALKALDECLKYSPDDVAILRARAALRTRLGEYAGAQTDYTRVLERGPDAATYAARGWNYVFADAPKLALADFEESIRLAPDRAESYVGRGYAQVLLGKCQQGVRDAEEALRRGPRTPRLWYNAARVYAQASARIAAELPRHPGTAADLRNEWRNRAIQLLVQTFDMQKPAEAERFWQDFVQSDLTLNPIRRMRGFEQLAARFASRQAQAISSPSLESGR